MYKGDSSLLRLIRKLGDCLDEKGLVNAIVLHFLRYFDLIDHDLSRSRLHAYCFCKKSLSFAFSCLNGRSRSAKLNNIYSI